jgi:hypothetical protein
MNDQNDSQPMTIFVLGLLSIIACQILGPVAWMMGNSYKAQCDVMGVPMNQMGQIGRILGMVGTALLAFNFVIVGLVFCLYGAIAVMAIAGGAH